MQSTICCIFNYPPHYRKSVYEHMDRELKCHFYFGDKVPGYLEEMDTSQLKGYQKRFKNYIWKSRIIWQSNILSLLFKPYKNYLLSVDTACLSAWIFIYLSKLFGKRIYFWTHGTYGRESFFKRLKNKLYFMPASGLLLYGNYARRILSYRGYRKDKMFIMANSLDYKLNIEIRDKLKKNNIYQEHFGNTYPTLVFIGRLEKKKRLELILKAISELKNQGILLNFIFIGEGIDSKNQLINLSKKLEIEKNIWFYGACYDEFTIGNLIYNAEICISPGNVGLTAIHSLSYGTPVITHSNYEKQMPEFEVIRPERNGLFFEENNVNSMSNTIKKWLETHPVKNEKLIEECHKIIDEKYNPYYQISVLKKIFNLNFILGLLSLF